MSETNDTNFGRQGYGTGISVQTGGGSVIGSIIGGSSNKIDNQNIQDTMNQGNTYQHSGTFGIGNMSGGTITGNSKIAGVINEDQSKNLTEVAAAIQDLLDYFEQNKPTEIEAERIVESAIERCSELNNAEIVEAAIKTNPNLQKRLKSASYALFIGTIKALRPSVGNVIETVVKAWQNPD